MSYSTAVNSTAAMTAAITNGSNDEIVGQGLAIAALGDGDTEPELFVLTCHHVIAPIDPADLRVRIPDSHGELGDPLTAFLVEDASDFSSDRAVLRLSFQVGPLQPTLYSMRPDLFIGPLDATGISYMTPGRFDGVLRAASPLDLPVRVRGGWSPAPSFYRIEHSLRLTLVSDAREGISGSPIVSEGGVIGLAHFARAEGQKVQREVYVVPLAAWAAGLPSLGELLTPLADRRLRAAATVRKAGQLEAGSHGPDVVLAEYKPDIYLKRGVDTLAHRAMQEGRGVILVGKPKSGKTRLALEVLRPDPGRVVIIPHDVTPPEIFEGSGLAGHAVTLLFDDLHRSWLTADPLSWVRRITEVTGLNCSILATCRDGNDWTHVQRQPGTSRLVEFLGVDAVVYCSSQPDGGADLSKGQAESLARELGLTPATARRRFDGTPGSLVLDLNAMRDRYKRLRETYIGQVSVSRLLDAVKLLDAVGLPQIRRDDARFVAEQVRGSGPLPSELWEDLIRRTQEEGFGGFAEEIFQVYRPYLEECVTYIPDRADAEKLIPFVEKRGDLDILRYLGQALFMWFDSPLAEKVLRKGMVPDDPSSAVMLSILLMNKEDIESQKEAEGLLKQAIAHGMDEYDNLGNLYARQNRLAEAERAYRDSIAAGHVISHFNLGNLLVQQPGRLAEAEGEYRAALDGGSPLGAEELSKILVYEGRFREAEAIIRKQLDRLEEADVPARTYRHFRASLMHRLAATFLQEGRIAEAEKAYRDAIKEARLGGDVSIVAIAGKELGDLLLKEQRNAEAEEVYLASADIGYARAFVALGRMLLNDVARHSEAEDWLRKAAAAGDSDGRFRLGLHLLKDPARHDEALAEMRAGAETGEPWHKYLLARWLAHKGADEEAERWVREALDSGVQDDEGVLWRLLDGKPGREAELEDALWAAARLRDGDAAVRLGLSLRDVPGREQEAEEALTMAVAAGNAEGLALLGDLIGRDPRRAEEAESLLRRAADARTLFGHLLLGQFLAGDPRRHDEAESELRQAAEDGRDWAWRGLAVLLQDKPGREDDARNALERAIELGVWGPGNE